jgi:hypothetical protein
MGAKAAKVLGSTLNSAGFSHAFSPFFPVRRILACEVVFIVREGVDLAMLDVHGTGAFLVGVG